MYTTKSVQSAYRMVRDRIVRGDYPAGFRITEQEIVNAAGVSRTPVREALRRLQAEGFVNVVPNVGAVVAEWTEANLRDVYELRALLEAYCVSRAAARVTPQGIAELRALAQEQYEESMRRAPGYFERISSLNRRFHRKLHDFSGNARLASMLPALIEAPLVLSTLARYEHADLLRSASHHLEIVDALEARNGEWAAAVMRSHIQAAHFVLSTKPASQTDEVMEEPRARDTG